jgi:hypothetical protein
MVIVTRQWPDSDPMVTRRLWTISHNKIYSQWEIL